MKTYMKTYGGILLAIFSPFLGHSQADRRAELLQGAEAYIRYRVVDDEGHPVPAADVKVWWETDYPRLIVKEEGARTDDDGRFEIKGKVNHALICGLDKMGFYHSTDRVAFRSRKIDPAIVDGRWQPYGEERTVVLKRMKNPIALYTSRGEEYHRYPRFDEWVGFDLQVRDWVYPHGKGEKEDVLIRFEKQITSDGYCKTMELAFTNNPYAGVYVRKNDDFSEMTSVYQADTNECFNGNMRYEFRRTAKGNVKVTLERGQYLVFRTRTAVDEKGDLKSAHYGKIYGDWRFSEKGGMAIGQVAFNPTPNDTNLEDAETARRSSQMWGTQSGVVQTEPFWTISGFASLLSVGAVQK